MPIVAITTFQVGQDDGSVETINIGDTLTGFDDDQLRDFVASGSAIDTDGKLGPAEAGDDETIKRDKIIAEAGQATSVDTANPVDQGTPLPRPSTDNKPKPPTPNTTDK